MYSFFDAVYGSRTLFLLLCTLASIIISSWKHRLRAGYTKRGECQLAISIVTYKVV